MTNDPYAPPRTIDAPPAAMVPSMRHGGIGRLVYLGITVLLTIVQRLFATYGLQLSGSSAGAGWGLFIVFTCIAFIPAYFRLKNAAMNPWTCLLLVVPILNLVILFRCYAYQEGYGEVKRLDKAGRIVAIIFITLFLAFIAFAFFGAAI
ncbi:hypothetical protein [Luteolibacter sp. Populi]|uniref:hypothetical protein n=1 Tax=Luteolibacter sp. Populi TaxID=3230487 RepID=UPI00346584A1